jgi:hypothetical protein
MDIAEITVCASYIHTISTNGLPYPNPITINITIHPLCPAVEAQK